MKKEAVIIVSGGMDSITLLHKIAREYLPENILAITFNYGSRHNTMEIPMAMNQCIKLGIDHKIIDMVQIFSNFNSALLDKKDSEPIPEGHYEEENMKKTVVPFRNGILLSIATGVAETIGASKIYYGAHAGDHTIYPDCRPEFVRAMNNAARKGTFNKVRILAPFSKIDKVEILKIGFNLGVDYSSTWTCYNPTNGISCGKCGSCQERLSAFKANGIEDPLEYKSRVIINKK